MKWSDARQIALARDWYQCQACLREEVLTVHHIWPRALGGSDEPYNLVTLCEECHRTLCDKCNRMRWARAGITSKSESWGLFSKPKSYILNWS